MDKLEGQLWVRLSCIGKYFDGTFSAECPDKFGNCKNGMLMKSSRSGRTEKNI